MHGRRRRSRDGREQPVPGTPADQTPDADPASVARSVALRQLTAAPRTRSQLAEALARKNVPGDVAEEVLERFEAVGLVDDAEYARMWVESRHTGRGLARRALEHELRSRGVDAVLAKEAAAQVDDDAELETAVRLCRRRLRSFATEDPQRRARRLLGMLARRGYGSAVALRALRIAVEELPTLDPGIADEGEPIEWDDDES
jgi:regulatory protein